MIDPVCLFHGKKASEHDCLFCCLCFESLTSEECAQDADGVKWDICVPCYVAEQTEGRVSAILDSEPSIGDCSACRAGQVSIVQGLCRECRAGGISSTGEA
jgi:hypothetical protein